MRKYLCLIVLALTICLGTSDVKADEFTGFQKGDWSVTLNGSGVSDKNLDDTIFAVTIAPSYFLNENFELGLRQSMSYNDGFAGATTAFLDYNFRMANPKWVPFIGVNCGYGYGEGVSDSWRAGPEAGLKYFVNDTTFLFGRAAYEFDLKDGFDSGGFAYGVGIGFRF